MLRAVLSSLIAVAVLVAPPLLAAPAPASCPVGETDPCVIRLRGESRPQISANCSAKPWATYLKLRQPDGLTDSDGNRWWEAVLEIDLEPSHGCRCAVFRAHYDETPRGFSVNVGDARTNDSGGGDDGETVWTAEAQIRDERLTVLTADFETHGRTDTDRLLQFDLPPVAHRVVELRVCNQLLGFKMVSDVEAESFSGVLSTFNTQHLFALAGQNDPLAPGGRADHRIWAGFNRVIKAVEGKPSKGRVGTGVGSVEVYLTP